MMQLFYETVCICKCHANGQVMLEMQSVPDILGSTTPARANPEIVADVRAPRQRVVAYRVQEVNGVATGQQALHMAHADILGSTPARASPEIVADVRVPRQRVVAYRVQEAVTSTPTPPQAELSGPGWLNEMFNETDCVTRGQQALHVARQRMQVSSTDAEIDQVVDTLALALGATRPEARTRKALLAVLVLLDRPEMSEQEVCASTGASFDDFKRWQRRVLNAQAGLPPPTDERY